MADLVIVDDDPEHLDLLAELMVGEGHAVRYGYNGEDGLRLVLERRPDLVLLDVEMPVLGGPGMAYRMFVHDLGLEDVPVVLMSGVMDLAAVARGVGTPYFLAKPYRYGQLLAMIERALEERIAPRPPADGPVPEGGTPAS